MTPEEARRDAVRRFGNATATAERARDFHMVAWLDTVVRNVRYAARGLRGNPGFAATAILSVALGVGADTAIFSLLNAVTPKRLPVPNPQELVSVGASVKRELRPIIEAEYRELQAHGSQYLELFTTALTSAPVTFGDQTESVSISLVSGNYYQALGVLPTLG